MTDEANALWDRAQRALRTANQIIGDDPDTAASRAYYAAFYAASRILQAVSRREPQNFPLPAANDHP